MIKVYQTKTVKNDGYGNCKNACVASILEIPLRDTPDIRPNQGGWYERWRVFLAEQGFKLSNHNADDPPRGYSLATVYTDRVYPEGHRKAGDKIAHACVAFDGIIVHDPYPIPSERCEIRYYDMLVELTPSEVEVHRVRMAAGICRHGYKSTCDTCIP